MGAHSVAAGRFFEQRFGRSIRAAHDVTRMTVAAGGLISALSAAQGSLLPQSVYAYALLLAWSFLIAILPVISWRRDVQLVGLVMAVDLIVIAAMIISHQAVVLLVLPYGLLLFLATQQSFLNWTHLAAIATVSVLIALFGMAEEPVAIASAIDARLLERLLFVLLCALGLVSIRTRARYLQNFAVWSEGLLIAGTHSQRIPLEFILERIESRYPGSQLAWIENDDSDRPRLLNWTGGKLSEARFPTESWKLAQPWMLAERTFMFDTGRRRILHRAEVDRPVVNARLDAQIAFIEELGFKGRGMSFPVRLADESARVLIGNTERPSLPALREIVEVGRAVEAVFERFHFQAAWRERAFLEARTALGRDLHDTVLQTMASLRMHVATILSRPAMQEEGEIRNAILKLQGTVAEEQRTFREILDEGHRVSTEAVELNAILANRMIALSKQWGIDCSFVPATDALMVDGNTAVQVEFIIREVVSNSVQHGRARSIAVRISLVDGMLMLAITNNEDRPRGVIENGTSSGINSRSLARRLTSVHASAYADGVVKGSLLSIRIPLSRS